MPYEDPDTRFPLIFHPFNDALNKDHDVMMATITPRAILVNFFGSGKASNLTYEFYNPSALAHQLAFGQLPIALCYADVIKLRETITNHLEWIRIAQLPPNADTDVDLSAWIPTLFITQAYKQWWEEWKEHLFCRSALTYRGMIDPQYKVPDNTVSISILTLQSLHFYFPSVTYFLCYIEADAIPPLVNRSGRPIELLPSGPISLIGNNAPTLAAIMHQGVCLKKVTTKRTKSSPSVAATALAQAFKVNFLYRFHSYAYYICTHKLLIVVSAHRYIGKDQKYDCRCPPVQSTEEKSSQEYQITSEAPENSNASPSSKVTDPGGIVSLFSKSPNTTSTISSSAIGRTPNRRTSARGTSARRYVG